MLDRSARRIGLVLERAPPEFVGGVERFAHALAAAWIEAGMTVVCVSATGEAHRGVDVVEGAHEGVRILRLPRLASEHDPFLLVRPRLRDLALGLLDGCAQVHVQRHDALSADLVPALASRTRARLWLHDHGASCARSFRHAPPPGEACPEPADAAVCARCLAREIAPACPDDWTRIRRALAEREAHARTALASAHELLAPSRFHADALARLHPGSAARVVEPGVHPAFLEPHEPRVDPLRLRVLHAGNHGEEKGTLDLAAALQLAAPGMATLVLAGRATVPDLVAKLRAAAPAVELEQHGPYEPRELVRIAATCDLAVHPSRLAESYGLAAAECAALGLPQLVSDQGALPERVGGDAESIVAAGDTAGLAARIRALLEHKRRDGILRRGVRVRARSTAETARALIS